MPYCNFLLITEKKHVMLIYVIIAMILSMYAVEEENLLDHITAVIIVSIIYLHGMIQNVVICFQKHCIML